ncbi:hypothetical protein [Streptomyces sp. NPDC002078]
MNLRSLVPVGAAAADLAGAPLASASTGSTHGTHQRTQTIQLVAKQARSQPIDVGNALPQGKITGQALLHLPARSTVDVAITGGSGAYSGAGHLTFHVNR